MEKPSIGESLENLTLQEQIRLLQDKVAVLDEANKDLVEQINGLSEKAYYDKLTGLRTRFSFDEELKPYFQDIFNKNPERREGDEVPAENVVFAIFDIDHFKQVNDTFGHQAGDDVLREVSDFIKHHVRKDDVVGRWGGEELVVAFIGATKDGAELKANFIRQKISELVFERYPNLKVTISAGLANVSDFDNEQDLFEAADGALYDSKEGGRNQVTFFSKK